AAARRRELLEALVRHFPNGAVFLFDRDLRYLLAGGTGVLLAGRNPAELRGKTLAEVLPAEVSSWLEPIYRDVLAGRDISLERNYHEHTLVVRGAPVRGAAGAIYAGLVMTQDVTEQKLVERELRRRGEQLAEADRRKDE